MIFLFLFFQFHTYQYRTYTRNYNQKINAIIAHLKEKYPAISTNELVDILNQMKRDSQNGLGMYGIDLKKEAIIQENDQFYHLFQILNFLFLLGIFLLIYYLFLKFQHKQNKRIQEIIQLLEQINQKNYEIDVGDHEEDNISILKNELYKTTIMLKEHAENSLKDKINLKNSLEDISHQLKTPLTSILINLDNLDESLISIEERTEILTQIRRETMNINFLIQALLKLSKFDTNTISFVKKQVKISQILTKSIENLSALCDLKNIKVTVRGDSNLEILCDYKWQVEALTNILKNCVEHSNTNGSIHIFYEKNKLYAQIIIEDYGSGISKKELPHIFERFYKGESASKDSIGIGLALSKTIIEKENGRVLVDSIKGKKTTFTIQYFY